MIDIPTYVVFYGWLPFFGVILLTLAFSFYYARKYRDRYNSEWTTTSVVVLGLAVALLSSLLVPVDVFLVSYMKNADGTFKEWANNSTREYIEVTLERGYYVLYVICFIFIFAIIPFAYFLHEEKEDDHEVNVRQRACSACKYTIVIILIAAALLIVGAVIPLAGPPPTNSTEWKKIEFIISELGKNTPVDILSFMLNVLTVIGMALYVIYTGMGLALLPLGMIKGRRNASTEQAQTANRRTLLQNQLYALRAKYRNERTMSRRDRLLAEDLEEEIRFLERQEHHLVQALRNFCYHFQSFLRPFEIILGLAGCVVGFIICLSFTLSNVDRLLHSMGPKSGYTLIETTLPNIVDLILTYAQQVFPVDYIIFSMIIVFFVVASLEGLRKVGIRFLWVRLYRIRPHKTRPQALLLMCVTLMLIILAMNVVIYSLVPQYCTFGNQHYLTTTVQDGTNHTVIYPCDLQAPTGECTMSRMSVLLTSYFYKAWLFGAIYYWMNWLMLGGVIVGAIVSFFTKQESVIDGAVDNDDFDESDEDLLAV